MSKIVADDGDQLCRLALAAVLRDGQHASPRGKPVIELVEPIVLVLADPTKPFLMSPARRANYRFGMAEACWICSGSDSVEEIAKYNSRMREFSDDGRALWGAYGPRVVGQLAHVVSTLKRDPDSRQAVITTWRPQVGSVDCLTGGYVKELYHGGLVHADESGVQWDGASWRSKDIPCTVAWHFMIRGGRLNLTVFMRSNDAWLGTPYDIFSFTTVQRAVASILEVGVGTYHHVPSNLHLYEENVADAQGLLLSPPVPSAQLPDFNFTDIDDMVMAFSLALSGESTPGNPGIDAYTAVIHRLPGAIAVPTR